VSLDMSTRLGAARASTASSTASTASLTSMISSLCGGTGAGAGVEWDGHPEDIGGAWLVAKRDPGFLGPGTTKGPPGHRTTSLPAPTPVRVGVPGPDACYGPGPGGGEGVVGGEGPTRGGGSGVHRQPEGWRSRAREGPGPGPRPGTTGRARTPLHPIDPAAGADLPV
jgi:uncharacterized membrane protein